MTAYNVTDEFNDFGEDLEVISSDEEGNLYLAKGKYASGQAYFFTELIL